MVGDLQPGRAHARHDGGPGGRADRGCRVGVGERILGCQLIEVRGVQQSIALTVQVHPAQVICHDEQDMGFFCRLQGLRMVESPGQEEGMSKNPTDAWGICCDPGRLRGIIVVRNKVSLRAGQGSPLLDSCCCLPTLLPVCLLFEQPLTMSTIYEIDAREILDSRGNPTVEVDVILSDGSLGRDRFPLEPMREKKKPLN